MGSKIAFYRVLTSLPASTEVITPPGELDEPLHSAELNNTLQKVVGDGPFKTVGPTEIN